MTSQAITAIPAAEALWKLIFQRKVIAKNMTVCKHIAAAKATADPYAVGPYGPH